MTKREHTRRIEQAMGMTYAKLGKLRAECNAAARVGHDVTDLRAALQAAYAAAQAYRNTHELDPYLEPWSEAYRAQQLSKAQGVAVV